MGVAAGPTRTGTYLPEWAQFLFSRTLTSTVMIIMCHLSKITIEKQKKLATQILILLCKGHSKGYLMADLMSVNLIRGGGGLFSNTGWGGGWCTAGLLAMDSNMTDMDGSLVVNVDDLRFLKGITTTHWNCRSLFSKIIDAYLMVTHSNCEICILSETWLTSAVSDEYIEIDGYNLMRLDRNEDLGKKRGGGLVVYTKNDLKATIVPDLCVSMACVEIITLHLDLNYTKPIYVMGVYRP